MKKAFISINENCKVQPKIIQSITFFSCHGPFNMTWSCIIQLVILPFHSTHCLTESPMSTSATPSSKYTSTTPSPWLHTTPSSNTTTLLLLIFHSRTITIIIINLAKSNSLPSDKTSSLLLGIWALWDVALLYFV